MDFEDHFHYENNFYITAPVKRFSKFITHLDLFRRISNIRGEIVECGVFKGNSLMRWIKFRSLLENSFSRKIYGFDTFGKFPDASLEEERRKRNEFINEAGNESVKKKEFQEYLEKLNLKENVYLIEGDINNTVPDFISKNNEIRISLLHIDVDLYEPTKVCIENFYPHVARGGIIILDDYGAFPGANKAVEEFIENKNFKVEQLRYSNSISFITKN
ncbi:MAG: Demethyldecarbamoylnovobiocin O-methyltransferase [Alphaproteobacteria bacterium MarineAlpha9_Bin4]|nr:dTDP-6-deoxy-L-hexose 3-O-methyltransferase [Pelagibacterales bacterium]PPR25008.1 MAG: Demethyldecarbamoylnovobiocin O-methyltransferase [Alphaproteobacteria bacterium MarineAlpha9_Bin4]|tara:strand:- start:1023 stop:1673 length:651 start_codon:yes stop_codon:yes gene_type:complete